MRVLHVITHLEAGGAQRTLLSLLDGVTGIEHQVVSLRGGGVLERDIAARTALDVIGMRPNVPDPRAIGKVTAAIRSMRPGLVQTWLYHADFVGGLAARRAGVPVVWNVRHAGVTHDGLRLPTWVLARVNARLSGRVPARIICASEAGRTSHAAIGYDEGRMVVIPNGIDVDRFRPDPSAATTVRADLGIPPSAALVGMIARFTPVKDHGTFFAAAARLPEHVHFVLAGEDVAPSNGALLAMAEAARVADRTHLLGVRHDVPRLLAALDVLVMCSTTEAFPNVVAEAMACETAVAATDVGDTHRIVGDLARTIPPREPKALAGLVESLLGGTDSSRRARFRARVVKEFSLDEMRARYAAVYAGVLEEVSGRPNR